MPATMHLRDECVGPSGTDRAMMTLPVSFVAGPGSVAVRALLHALVAALPGPLDLLLVGHEAAFAALGALTAAPTVRTRRQVVSASTNFTVWCQDTILAPAVAGRAPEFLITARRRRQDHTVAWEAARHFGLNARDSDVAFEGGNILETPSTILVGADAPDGLDAAFASLGDARPFVRIGGIREAKPHLQVIAAGGETMIEEVFGYGGKRQPLFHLDQFITFAGQDESGRDRLFVADSRIEGASAEKAPVDRASADRLDEIARRLASDGRFVVSRMPLPIIAIDDIGLQEWTRDRIARRYAGWDGLGDVLAHFDRFGARTMAMRRWRAATYNGGLVFERARQVILPSYGHRRHAWLAAFDEEARRLWETIGYTVTVLPNALPLALEHGSPHCLFKQLPPVSASNRCHPIAAERRLS